LSLGSLTAPIFDADGKVIAAINIPTQSAVMSVHELTSNYLPVLLSTTSEISHDLVMARNYGLRGHKKFLDLSTLSSQYSSMTNQNDNDIVLCSPLRTPVGRYGGIFRDIPVEDLATTVVDAIVERTGVTAQDVDDIILGQASPNGAAPALGRIVALNSALGKEVPGMQLDRRCGSGLQAVMTAAAHVAVGAADLIIAGGAESMSRTEYTVDGAIRWGV